MEFYFNKEIAMKIDNLEDTVDFMTSDDYRDRMLGEYLQLYIRFEKLRKMLDKEKDGTLDFTPTCPILILEKQCSIMKEYIDILEERIKLEGIQVELLHQ